MNLPLFQVDAFTNQLFRGNPAAVCLLDRKHDDRWMQALAAEMNLSETAFLLKQPDGYSLRWFTPGIEVDLCGHATLASAHVLFETGRASNGEEIHFHTLSGLLTASLKDDWIELNFPTQPPEEIEPPKDLIEAIGISPTFCGKSKNKYLFEVADENILKKLQPDFSAISKLTKEDMIITSASATENFDFVSRFFAPGIGINEDPVTGSAHCVLAPYWHDRLGKFEFNAFQASSRGGVLKVRLAGDRTFISGQAITVFKGELAD